MPLIVEEVIRRSKQGRTHPYICRCDDGEIYFAKGHCATRRGLINEWLCGNLGRKFGLPIADFAIATVPDELVNEDLTGWLKDLGPGEVFVSKKVSALDLTNSHLDLVPLSQRRDLIAFDWWIRNGDRTLTAIGGNPNLLWKTDNEGSLVVIDHNLAFDHDFTADDLLNFHVFHDDIPQMFSDFIVRETYASRFRTAIGVWDESCATLPSSWSFIDTEKTLSVEFPFRETKALLDEALTEKFWHLQS